MVLDNRRAHLLSIIKDSQNPVPTDELVRQMNVSQRTIYYDMQQINNWLSSKSLETIQNQHGKGFFLNESVKNVLESEHQLTTDSWYYHYSTEERRLLITVILLTDEQGASMESFMQATQMSRGTVAKDLNHVKEDFKNRGFPITYHKGSGYHIDATEEDKRQLLADTLANVFADSKWSTVRNDIYKLIQSEKAFPAEKMEQQQLVKTLLFQAEKELGLTLTDEMIEMLTIQILIVIKRTNNNQSITVDEEEKIVLQQTRAYEAAKAITEKIEEIWNLTLPDSETCFLAMYLLGSKVQHDDFSQHKRNELAGLEQVVQRMIKDFQSYACVIFQDQEGLERNLITHIKPAYYRLKYGVKIANQLTEQILKNYQDVFHLTKKVIYHLEYFVGQPISDEEIAYITLHFGGWLTKEEKQVETKFRAIIVCENGIGTSNMLKTQLENMIVGMEIVATLSMREYYQFDQPTDVIFSTNYIKPKDIPVIHVPAILTNDDKELVMTRMNELFKGESGLTKVDLALRTIEKYATVHDHNNLKQELTSILEQNSSQVKELRKPMLNELLTHETIRFKDSVGDWEEAIREASAPLLEQQSIQPKYVEAMINNVKELGPYIVIAPKIAIPHARPEAGVERLGMSFLRVKEEVHFSEKEKHRAQLIIVLAAIDNETHLKALAQLTDVLSNEENIDRLIEANESEEVIELINQHVNA
ncbi:BglG family transcription antiterminator [Thalassobacillus hwangdonensis]|uniref:BglG family transcription antiterminator n=1 Tax=Thalassobacillus hwangdonensis TaxID=546108 RepID=A0ABW3L566_9BACI